MVCWTPYAIVAFSYYVNEYSKVPVEVSVIAVLCAKLCTMLNPLVYYFSVQRFR